MLDDDSWMSDLAGAGFDVFSMDTAACGRSTRPPAMNDPCNLSAEQQTAFIPGLRAALGTDRAGSGPRLRRATSNPQMRLLWLLAGLAAVSAGCDLGGEVPLPAVTSPFACDASWPPSQTARGIPPDWDAAVTRIARCVPPDEYQVIRQESEATYGAWAYMGLGFALRNEWLRPDSSPLAAHLRALGFEYPDDMSAALLSAVWHQVHGQRTDVRARVACIRAWNLEMQRLARSAPAGGRITDPDFTCEDDQAVQAARTHWEAAGR